MTTQLTSDVNSELDRLIEGFFSAVSFEAGELPGYEDIRVLFIENGLLIKNVGTTPEITNVVQFIESRQRTFSAGDLTRFRETEMSETTECFGNVAHRLSAYLKSGTMKGVPFAARGMVSTQFIRTPEGWRMSSMAWDDERPGLSLPER